MEASQKTKSMVNIYKRPLIAILFTVAIFTLSACSSNSVKTIKYREDSVNVNTPAFESLDTSKSSWVRGAQYDAKQEYLIIDLQGVNYSYCGVPSDVWDSFKEAESFGTEYNATIKGHFSCEGLKQPAY